MNKYLFPIYAVIIGALIVFIIKPNKPKNTKLLLAFSGAFLLSITIFEIIPEAFSSGHEKVVGLFILLGILLQIILEYFSKGVEHGHIHTPTNTTIPWSVLIGLFIHAFLEGFPIKQDNNLMYGILVHKLPVTIILVTFLMQTAVKKWQILVILLLFALMTPLGTIITNQTNLLQHIEPYVNALVIGTFLHISTIILFESSEGHKFNLNKLVAIVLAISIAYIL